jgi:MFS superfamily sulfate permease-like transporter
MLSNQLKKERRNGAIKHGHLLVLYFHSLALLFVVSITSYYFCSRYVIIFLHHNIANAAWRIKHNDHYSDPLFKYDHEYNAYYLKIVGKVPPGLDFIHQPSFHHSENEMLKEAVPLALIAFMESYSVARKIAARRGLFFCEIYNLFSYQVYDIFAEPNLYYV